jgi:hypothetical protein
LISREVLEHTESCVADDEENNEIVIGVPPKDRTFTYDYVLGPEATQQEVYERCGVQNLVDSCFQGVNGTIFAYGQTGSGKTYTMGSFAAGADCPVDNLGILPRVATRLFCRIEELKLQHQQEAEFEKENGYDGAPAEETVFTVRMTFLEIHKEVVRDLLRPDAASIKVKVRDNGKGSLRISGLKPVVVRSEEDLLTHVNRGCIMRTTGSTLMNEHSSRSHAIITIMLEQHTKQVRPRRESKTAGRPGRQNYKVAKLHIVDLAGSERQKRTGAVGKRFQESVRINQGLLALSNVISALGNPRRHRKNAHRHVPYRESKLTRLLQDSLGGNSRTLMIACVTPALNSLEETLCVLKYANRARNIKNKPRVNVEPELPEVSSAEESGSDGSDTEEGEEEDIEEDIQIIGDDELNEAVKLSMMAEEAKADMELQTLRDELKRVKDDLVSSEARVSFLQDRINVVESELGSSSRTKDTAELALKEAKKDLQRDEIIFAEKMRQFAELQKKAQKWYATNKTLKAKLEQATGLLKAREAARTCTKSTNTAGGAVGPARTSGDGRGAHPAGTKDVGVQQDGGSFRSETSTQVSQDLKFLPQSPGPIEEKTLVAEAATNTSFVRDEPEAAGEGDIVAQRLGGTDPQFVNDLLNTKNNDGDDDEVTIMLGDDSFAPRESAAPGVLDSQEMLNASTNSTNIAEAWLEDVTDGLAKRKEEDGKLREKTAQLQILHSEREAARKLRSSMTKDHPDEEHLQNQLEALDVQVDVHSAAVAVHERQASENNVDLTQVYEALDDLDEAEARSLLRRCCARMAHLKEERSAQEVGMVEDKMKIKAQAKKLSALELALHKTSIEYDRRLRDQRHRYEERMRALLTAKPVKLKRGALKEIDPFANGIKNRVEI